MVLPAGSYATPSGSPVDGKQTMVSAGVPETVRLSGGASDKQTTAVNVTVLSTDVEKPLGLASLAFDIETDDSIGMSVSFADVIASGVNGQFRLILKETVSNVVLIDSFIDVGTVSQSVNEFLADAASGNEPNANLELFATGVTRDITFTNNVTAGEMTIFRTRNADFSLIKV